MQKTLAELASLTDATLQGNGDCLVTGINTLQAAKPGDLTFLHNIKYKPLLAETKASVVILSQAVAASCPTNALIASDPYFTYTQIASLFEYQPKAGAGVHASAVIGEHCKIDSTASVGANVTIGDYVTIGANTVIGPGCVVESYCVIGENTKLHPNVTLYHHVRLGCDVLLHAGVVIGADGFGNAMHQGRWHKVPQLGAVIIKDDVEIGANTSIDRGAVGNTIIHQGVRLDNLIQVGHNVEIGAHTAIAACTGIAGSVKIGKYCLIGGSVNINGHIEITDKTVVTGMSSVVHSIKEPGIYSSGHVAEKNLSWRKNVIRFWQLDSIAKRLKRLEKKVGEKDD